MASKVAREELGADKQWLIDVFEAFANNAAAEERADSLIATSEESSWQPYWRGRQKALREAITATQDALLYKDLLTNLEELRAGAELNIDRFKHIEGHRVMYTAMERTLKYCARMVAERRDLGS